MAELILNNLGTIAVGLILLAVVVLILVGMRRDRRAGKHSCGGDCSCCAGACACHGEEK